ncbi:MAG TPA: hypothetical protein VFS40_15955 [Gemmatimonadales bacterium]|nr:hypothetical protein [Gemmatimonadales bacterium]
MNASTGAPPRSGPMAGMPMTTGSLVLPGAHFAAATLFLVAGGLGVARVAPELAAGAHLSPHVAGVTHLFTLGWITTTIFGALYQLLPVALGTPVRWPWLGHASLALFAPGVAVFAASVFLVSATLHHVGIALVASGILLVTANVGATLLRAPQRDASARAVALALLFLVATLALGILLLHNFHTGFLGARRLAFLAAHAHVALGGWVLVMIVGMSHRLLPMFLVAHGVEARWTGRALALLAAGVPLLAAGLLGDVGALAWIGLLLMEAGLACFLVQARTFYRKRIRRRLDPGLRFAAVALGLLAAAALLAPAVLARGATHPRLATAYGLVGLLGGFAIYVACLGYKIVPFLAWLGRYRDRMGREPVPAVADLFSATLARWQLGLMVAAVAALALAVAGGSAVAAQLAALAYALSTLGYAGQMLRVAVGAPRKATHG